MRISLDKIQGAVYGLAYGDALGYPLEFMSHDLIMRKANRTNPKLLRVSDDTQMSISVVRGFTDTYTEVGEELVNIEKDEAMQSLFARNVAEHFIQFYHDPDNNRAPGNTCMGAIKRYMKSAKESGLEGSFTDSKGCGANMRSGWLGLLPYAEEDLITMSILQAKVTHGHPDALIASALTTLLVHHLAKGKILPSQDGALIRHSIHLLDNHRFLDGERVLDPQDLRKLFTEALIAFPEYLYSSPSDDICSFFGEGWTADEAIVLAVAATDAQNGSEEATEGILRLAEGSGDSDSIAAIGGALIGSYRGVDQIRRSTGYMNFEPRYAEELEWVTRKLAAVNVNWHD